MAEQKEQALESGLSDRVIDHLYEVAVDPSRYEALLDHWEELIAPQRDAANADQIPPDQLRRFEGHFQRANRVLRDVTVPMSRMSPVQLLARMERAAALVLDADATISHVNAAAAAAFGIAPGAPLDALPLAEGEADALEAVARRLMAANTDTPALLRLAGAKADRTMLFSLRRVRPENDPPFVLVISSEVGWPEGFGRMLRDAFDLTQAETQVVRALAGGSSLTEIAEARERSVETIRAQVKAVLAKTGTRNQAELVRLTLSTMEMAQYSQGFSDPETDASEGFGTLIPRPYQTMHHPDGRRQDYLILGAQEGRPVIYLPLDYGLVRWPSSVEAEATARGLKIVVPVRPGYGQSTPLPRAADYVPTLIADMAALMDHLEISRAPLLTLGGDSFLAYSFHEAFPGRVSGIICCAGVLPLTRSDQYERMDKWHRFILAGARYTPHLLPFMVKAGFALANRLGKRAFVQAVYGNSEADKTTFDIPEVYEAMVCGSEVCLSETHSAHDAFAREVIAHETSDWTRAMLALEKAAKRPDSPVPVIFFNGLQDPEVPEITLDEHRAEMPWIDFRVYPDAGQLIFFLKWRDVLDALDPLAGPDKR